MIRKKNDLSTRLQQSSAALNAVVSEFQYVAGTLSAVADEHDRIAEEASTEIDRLLGLRDAAIAESQRAERVAGRVADLVA